LCRIRRMTKEPPFVLLVEVQLERLAYWHGEADVGAIPRHLERIRQNARRQDRVPVSRIFWEPDEYRIVVEVPATDEAQRYGAAWFQWVAQDAVHAMTSGLPGGNVVGVMGVFYPVPLTNEAPEGNRRDKG
jgi:hypothetical protein